MTEFKILRSTLDVKVSVEFVPPLIGEYGYMDRALFAVDSATFSVGDDRTISYVSGRGRKCRKDGSIGLVAGPAYGLHESNTPDDVTAAVLEAYDELIGKAVTA